MATVVCSEPALADLDAIADYIALRDERAARELVRRILDHVGRLADHPLSGAQLPEFENWGYRQIVEPPCRVIYRTDGETVHIVHVVRDERLLNTVRLRSGEPP